jgi:hypothetical protein
LKNSKQQIAKAQAEDDEEWEADDVLKMLNNL